VINKNGLYSKQRIREYAESWILKSRKNKKKEKWNKDDSGRGDWERDQEQT